MMYNIEKVLHILPTGEGKQSAGKVAQGGGRHVGRTDCRYDAFVCDSWAAIVDEKNKEKRRVR